MNYYQLGYDSFSEENSDVFPPYFPELDYATPEEYRQFDQGYRDARAVFLKVNCWYFVMHQRKLLEDHNVTQSGGYYKMKIDGREYSFQLEDLD